MTQPIAIMIVVASETPVQWPGSPPVFAVGSEGEVDPRRESSALVRVTAGAQLELALAGQHDGKPRTAGEWADARRFVVTINAGMYEKDFLTNALNRVKEIEQANFK